MVVIGIEKAEMSLQRLAKKTKSKFFIRVSKLKNFSALKTWGQEIFLVDDVHEMCHHFDKKINRFFANFLKFLLFQFNFSA